MHYDEDGYYFIDRDGDMFPVVSQCKSELFYLVDFELPPNWSGICAKYLV